MKTLVVGASGATGQLVVKQLLQRGQHVKIVVRSPEKVPTLLRENSNVSLFHTDIFDVSDNDLSKYIEECHAVVSCLGHNMSFKGIYGHPRMLVTGVTRRLCDAIRVNRSETPVKFVLMNSAGVSNRDLPEYTSSGQKCVICLLRKLLPPHVDNEMAADYLRTSVNNNDKLLEWAVVRPDSLTDDSEVSEYVVHPSPMRSAIFDPGRTSRINVANFIAELITDRGMWSRWKGKMPVIYNKELS